MLVFIDESGDAGFQINKGSSPIFVIALVIFAENTDAERTASALKTLKQGLHFPDSMEFKYSKSRLVVKQKFFACCTHLPFTIRAIVVQKNIITSHHLQNHTEHFYNYFIGQVLKHANGTIRNAKLKVDKRGEKRVRDELRTYLSRELDNKHTKIFDEVKGVDSKEDILVQLADMVAGCIAAHSQEKNSDIFKLLTPRIDDIWSFQ